MELDNDRLSVSSIEAESVALVLVVCVSDVVVDVVSERDDDSDVVVVVDCVLLVLAVASSR